MKPKFVNPDKASIAMGEVAMVCASPEGEVRFSHEGPNTFLSGYTAALMRTMSGTWPNLFSPIKDFCTGSARGGADWNDKDGIVVFETALTDGKGTLLICATDDGPWRPAGDQWIPTWSCSGYNTLGAGTSSGTIGRFCLGADYETAGAADRCSNEYFEHQPTPFGWTSGDTLSVSWTVSFPPAGI